MSLPIVYCMMSQNSLLETKECIDLVSPYVDKVVLIDGASSDDSIFWFRNLDSEDPDFHFFVHPWSNNFSKQRNNYLKRAREVIGTDDFWCLISDSDEFFEHETLRNIYKVQDECERRGFNMASFQCRSITLKYSKRVWENLDDYWKGLFLKWHSDLHYYNNPHESISMPGGHRVLQTNLIYEHRKQENIIWKKGTRNMITGGGGPNLNDSNKLWVELKNIVREVYDEDLKWHSFHSEMLKGNIDQRVKDWMVKVRKESGWDGASEHRECYKYYFRILHPEEEPEELRDEYIP